MQITVILCTHNPRLDYIQRTLAALNVQTLPKQHWELILIDNGSTQPLAESCDLSWHPQARVVKEETLGLTPARLRGIREASADLLVFVDDDNVLGPDYLETALRIANEKPFLGCFGAGQIEPEFEEPPAPNLTPYLPMLALRSVQFETWSNQPSDSFVPWGAGLVVRALVARAHASNVTSSTLSGHLDRKGLELNSGGDDEFSWSACAMGFGKGLFPSLRVLHLIGRARTQRQYMLRLAEGHAFSHALLNWIHLGTLPALAEYSPTKTAIQHMRSGRLLAFLKTSFKETRLLLNSSTSRAFLSSYRAGTARARNWIISHEGFKPVNS
jgi:glycosyltransferase involved in cell wall biosynthesis